MNVTNVINIYLPLPIRRDNLNVQRLDGAVINIEKYKRVGARRFQVLFRVQVMSSHETCRDIRNESSLSF